jgi:hypothetical protein
MFFNAVYRLPIWKKLDNKTRNLRLLILGAILYIAVHSLIQSKYLESDELVKNYKHYLYYITAIDLVIVGIFMYLQNNSDNKKKLKKGKSNTKKLLPNPIRTNMIVPQMQQKMIPSMQYNMFPQNIFQKQNTIPKKADDNISIELPIYNGNNNECQIQQDDIDIPIYKNNTQINIDDEIPIYK